MNDEQQHCTLERQRIGEEQHAPTHGDAHEQQHANLDEPPYIEAIGQHAGVAAEQKIRHPMRNHGKPAQGCGVKLLEYHPVADDVLDIVRHHRDGGKRQVAPQVAVFEGDEGAMLG